MEQFFYPSKTGLCSIAAYKWLPAGEPAAVIQIVHGMAEHAKRYDDIANYFTGLGYAVFAEDHPGHGDSINGKGVKGYFAENNGWSLVVEDIMTLHEMIKAEYPGKKMILYGHSMGSFLARTCASRYNSEFDAFIFSGTAGKNPVLAIAKAMASSHIKKNGGQKPDDQLNSLGFGAYNKRIKDQRTPFDWLSRDNAVVDKYIADDLCGFTFTSAAFRDMFEGLGEVSGKQWAEKVENVPIYLVAGKEDPVGSYGKGVVEVCENLRKTGHTKVVLQLYEGGRHEMHNETNRMEVYSGIAAFLRSV
ncbi:MAG: lysophospholipase [Clostridiales bacterium]|nr:lysophospholipase [Clostridiales bacterium]